MKTPDDFAQVINDRKANKNWRTKRDKPPSVIVTLIFAVFFLTVGAWGALNLGAMVGGALRGQVFFFPWMGYVSLQLGIMGLASATIFACLKRPRWGRPVSIVFALFVGIRFGLLLAFPDPHPVFAIAPGAEQAGADAAQAMAAFGTLVYLWSMIMGAKARSYFAEV